MGKLERKLDLDVIARIAAGIRHEPKALKKQKPPRSALSYRGAKRNRVLRGPIKGVWKGIKPTTIAYHPPVRPNRSRKWDGVLKAAVGW